MEKSERWKEPNVNRVCECTKNYQNYLDSTENSRQYIYIYIKVWSLSSSEPTLNQLKPERWKEPNVNRAHEGSRVGTISSRLYSNTVLDHSISLKDDSRQQLIQLPRAKSKQPTVCQSQLKQSVLSVYCETQSQTETINLALSISPVSVLRDAITIRDNKLDLLLSVYCNCTITAEHITTPQLDHATVSVLGPQSLQITSSHIMHGNITMQHINACMGMQLVGHAVRPVRETRDSPVSHLDLTRIHPKTPD